MSGGYEGYGGGAAVCVCVSPVIMFLWGEKVPSEVKERDELCGERSAVDEPFGREHRLGDPLSVGSRHRHLRKG